MQKKNKQSYSAEALMVRGRSSSKKGKGDRGRSKSRPVFKNLEKNQCTFCKKLGHWKVDCPRIRDKNEKSKFETNLIHVINTQSGSTSQADVSDSDSSIFLFSFTTLAIGN